MSNRERRVVRATTQDLATWDMYLFAYRPQPGDMVVDLGAGVGVEARVFAGMVAPTGRVISVESDARMFRCLRQTIELNGLRNVTAVRSAIIGWTGVAEPLVAGEQLAELTERLGVGRIDFLKMNVGGAELDVLASARTVLRRVHNIAVSCHDFRADEGGGTWLRTSSAVGDLLCEAGFTVRQRPADPRPWIHCCVYGSR